MSFAQLNLSQQLLHALQKSGYKQPTPIQAQAIPCVLAGKDLIATAQTGTGKTAAFVLPALEYLLKTSKQTLPSILILAPVRELATQITTAIAKYSSQARVKVVSVFGGMPYQAQMRQLSQPVDIIVATPGRLIDYLNRGKINLSQIKMLVLDEADRMLDMGFIEDVKLIEKYLPKKRQTLLFTATMDERITKLAQSLLSFPEHIAIKSGNSITLNKTQQVVYITDDLNHKNQLLEHLLTSENIYKGIIFSATKRHADKLCYQLRDKGHSVDALHGDIRQRKRNFILEQFRRGKINLLVATDVAARGIDVADVSHVINFDIPRTTEDYVHRIGRTGRAGKEGKAISFILYNESEQLKRIERFINGNITQDIIIGLEPKKIGKSSDHKNKKPWRGKAKNHRNSNQRHNRHESSNRFQNSRNDKNHAQRAAGKSNNVSTDRREKNNHGFKKDVDSKFHHRHHEKKTHDHQQEHKDGYIKRRPSKNKNHQSHSKKSTESHHYKTNKNFSRRKKRHQNSRETFADKNNQS